MKDHNFYAGGVDRAALHRRDAAWLAERLAHPESRFVPLWRGENLFLAAEGAVPRAALLRRHQIADAAAVEPILLGIDEERAYFGLDLSDREAPLEALAEVANAAFMDLRRVGSLLSRQEGALLAQARGLGYWHGQHRFCGKCAAPTRSEDAGYVRRCTNPACGISHFPRTDPAVIMLVHDGERCLLGRKPGWPPGMHSTLAGFVEPGESLEEAVAREVLEETGVRVGEVDYHSSQPWPFPASLMLGFHARAVSTAITVDPIELEDARWFERSFLLAHRDDESFRLPRGDSIARRLLEDWLARQP